MNKIRKILLNLLLLGASIAVGLFVIEAILRQTDRQSFDINREFILTDHSVFAYSPGYWYTLKRQEYTTPLKFNSKGLRDGETDYAKPENTTRIIMIGDSYIIAKEVPVEKRASEKLESKLNNFSKNANFEVINMGYGGFGPTSETILLEKEGSKYNPDIVIFAIFVGNDVSKIDFGIAGSVPKELFEKHSSLENVELKVTGTQKLKHFAFRNYFTLTYFRLLKKRVESLDTQNALTDAYYSDITNVLNKQWSGDTNEKFAKLDAIIRHLDRYSKENKIKLLVVLLPMREQVDRRKFDEFLNKTRISKSDLDTTKIQKMLLNITQKNNIAVLDLLPEFSKRNINNTFFFEIDGHWNEKGHELVADLIYKELLKNGYLS